MPAKPLWRRIKDFTEKHYHNIKFSGDNQNGIFLVSITGQNPVQVEYNISTEGEEEQTITITPSTLFAYTLSPIAGSPITWREIKKLLIRVTWTAYHVKLYSVLDSIPGLTRNNSTITWDETIKDVTWKFKFDATKMPPLVSITATCACLGTLWQKLTLTVSHNNDGFARLPESR